MAIYFIDEVLSTSNKVIFEKSITLNTEINSREVIYIQPDKLNITQFVTTALRCCGKLESQRMMLLPVDFQRQAFQLSIAKQNKQIYQEFEATTARVLDIWRHLFCDHGQNAAEKVDQDLHELVDAHKKSLQTFGLLDHFSISEIMKQDMLCKGRIFEKLQNLILVVEEIEKFSAVDLQILKIFSTHLECNKVTTLNAHRSLDISGIGDLIEDDDDVSPQVSFEITQMNMDKLFENLYEDSRIFQPKQKESHKRRIQQIFICHIRLLINTKDEFALALLLNLPGTDITPNIFAKIRNAAATKKMPIYQAIMSTVMRHQLGSKGYQPDKECPIVQHLKPLSVFMDFMMKLQDLIEEITEPEKCVLKILSKIKTTLRTVPGSFMKSHQLEHAYNVIYDDLKEMMEMDWSAVWGDVEEQVTSSCALQTLQTNSGYNTALKALQHLCDAEAGKNTHFFVKNYDFNSDCPQKTPSSHLKGSPQVELPSLVQIYKSPSTPAGEDHKNSGEETTSLLNRLQKNSMPKDQTPCREHAKRMRSHLDWIGEEVSPASNKSPATPKIFSPIVGPTLVAVGHRNTAANPAADWKETLEEIDKNIEARGAENKTVTTNKRKRALITDISNLPIETEPQKVVSSRKQDEGPKPKRKVAKSVKQIKGQQSIMKFFS